MTAPNTTVVGTPPDDGEVDGKAQTYLNAPTGSTSMQDMIKMQLMVADYSNKWMFMSGYYKVKFDLVKTCIRNITS